jgi:N-acetylglucosamine kinase-like BadF-type ATPase
MTDEALVLGLDVGGTSTRVLAVTARGVRRGAGRAAGGNPTGLGPERAAAALAEAVEQALTGLDPAAVRQVVVGLAGGGALPSGEDLPGGEIFARTWERLGIRGPVAYEPDPLIAFTAGTDAPEGSLLLSGTGAVAIAVKDHAMATRSDGHGWLLGDRGSGFWLGRRAVIAAMADLDGEGPATPLTALVVEALRIKPAGDRLVARDLVAAVMAGPPTDLARLAPLLTTACAAGDPVAQAVADRATEHLATSLATVRGPAAATPIVLAGSILTHPTPVADRVRRMLAERWPAAPVSEALDGAAAAAWLALARLGPVPTPEVRERLFSVSTVG